jgi:hypothetical protein
MARTGKIARLPLVIRTELNQRLRDGQMGTAILPWVNGLPEVRAILEAEFSNKDINAQNLSDWRTGGFQDWLTHQDRFHHTKLLAERSVELAKACGGNITEGASAILAGQILEVLEVLGDIRDVINAPAAEGEKEDRAAQMSSASEALDNLSNAIAKLRKGDQNNVRLAQIERDLKRKDEELSLAQDKYQRDTAGIALKILNDARAKEIEVGTGTNEEKIERMGQHIFGELWKPRPAA